jgi:hypothetical protein
LQAPKLRTLVLLRIVLAQAPIRATSTDALQAVCFRQDHVTWLRLAGIPLLQGATGEIQIILVSGDITWIAKVQSLHKTVFHAPVARSLLFQGRSLLIIVVLAQLVITALLDHSLPGLVPVDITTALKRCQVSPIVFLVLLDTIAKLPTFCLSRACQGRTRRSTASLLAKLAILVLRVHTALILA